MVIHRFHSLEARCIVLMKRPFLLFNFFPPFNAISTNAISHVPIRSITNKSGITEQNTKSKEILSGVAKLYTSMKKMYVKVQY